MHHGAATTIYKKGEEEQGESLGWTSGDEMGAMGR